MKKAITLLFTFILFNCATKPGLTEPDEPIDPNLRFRHNFTSVTYHPNGFISGGTLRGNQTISYINFKSRTQISFHPNGLIRGGTLNYNYNFNYISFKSHNNYRFLFQRANIMGCIKRRSNHSRYQF